MAIIRWNPWNISSLLEDDVDLPTNLSRFIGQGLNLYETEESFVAEAAFPGVSEQDIDITIDQGIVRLSGKADESQEEKSKKKYFMSSMASTYNYSFKLPEGIVQDEEPVAELQDGVLTLQFKKAKKAEPKKIKVNAKSK